MIPDLANLTVPDWTELQERIDDFKSTGGFLSQRDIDVILDVVPLVYSVNEAEILDWDAAKHCAATTSRSLALALNRSKRDARD